MALPELSAVEARVLGCLLEKERTTPETYPLSLLALAAACNQSTNREPTTEYSEKTVEEGVNALREKGLATLVHAAGARVGKYRHNLPNLFELSPLETAVLCVLLLRGAQTPGELRARTERLAKPSTLEQIEQTLGGLCAGDDPLVTILPARPGQKERRYAQLLSPALPEAIAASLPPTIAPGTATRVETLEAQVAELRTDLAGLREEFAAFRRQFE